MTTKDTLAELLDSMRGQKSDDYKLIKHLWPNKDYNEKNKQLEELLPNKDYKPNISPLQFKGDDGRYYDTPEALRVANWVHYSRTHPLEGFHGLELEGFHGLDPSENTIPLKNPLNYNKK